MDLVAVNDSKWCVRVAFLALFKRSLSSTIASLRALLEIILKKENMFSIFMRSDLESHDIKEVNIKKSEDLLQFLSQ